MNSSIIPSNSSTEARRNFIQDIFAWQNFAQRITKNPFVKKFLKERDGQNCSWCSKELQQNIVYLIARLAKN